MNDDRSFESGRGAMIEVPGFTILRNVGSGGFGSVYEAVQEDIGSRVALKVLPSNSDPGDAIRRLDREYRSMGRLRDRPAVVPVYGTASSTTGHPVIVMGFMAGGSLRDRVTRGGALTVDETLAVAATLAGVLEAAHELEIYHRDVKPENVLFNEEGLPFLGDFGLATIEGAVDSSATVASLSPPHAPPERFTTDDADPISGDIYSLCSTTYFMLTGRAPFGTTADGGLAGLITRITTADPYPIDRSDLDEDFAGLLLQGLARDPRARPSSAGEVRNRLVEIAAGRGTVITTRSIGANSDGPGPGDAERTRRVTDAEATEVLNDGSETRRTSDGETTDFPAAENNTRRVGKPEVLAPTGTRSVLESVGEESVAGTRSNRGRRVAAISAAAAAALIAGSLAIGATTGHSGEGSVAASPDVSSVTSTSVGEGSAPSTEPVESPEETAPSVPQTSTTQPTAKPPTTESPPPPQTTPPPTTPVSCANPGVTPTTSGLTCTSAALAGDGKTSYWDGNGSTYEVTVEAGGFISCRAAPDCPFVPA